MSKQVAFNVGDIVQLKSGGPEMTVQTVPASSITTYRCQWFAGRKLESGNFPAESLKPIKHEDK